MNYAKTNPMHSENKKFAADDIIFVVVDPKSCKMNLPGTDQSECKKKNEAPATKQETS